MYVVIVEFELHPEHGAAFVPLIRENARTTEETESGCRRFDVCLDPKNPAYVFLYELYDDRVAFEAHLATVHFRQFDSATAPMIREKKVRTLERA